MIVLEQKGDFSRSKRFMKRSLKSGYKRIIADYAKRGVELLSDSTPVSSGKTATSWYYDIEESKDVIRIIWSNSNIVDGVNIALIINYGHATKSGSYVQGMNYIDPVMQPLFEQLSKDVWKEVAG